MLMNHPTKIRIQSPGRINLIGEHIDYNGGNVLPAAIGHHIILTLSPREGTSCLIRSEHYAEPLEFSLNTIRVSPVAWHNYILGVVDEILRKRPGGLGGFEGIITGNLPIGSGISSSAALECGMATALNELFDLDFTDEELISISLRAEHNFVGTKCGIMDQFSVTKGKKDHFILLNCATMQYEYIHTNIAPYELLLLNTNVSHELSTSGYNDRLEECRAALAIINRHQPPSEYLVEVSEETLMRCKNELSPAAFNRSLYVIQENQRVLQAAKALRNGALKELGNYLYESHSGLQQLYEVSCPELDFLVDYTIDRDEVLGARMMGGGFGGCTINIIEKAKKQTFIDGISHAYKKRFNIECEIYEVSIVDGSSKPSNVEYIPVVDP